MQNIMTIDQHSLHSEPLNRITFCRVVSLFSLPIAEVCSKGADVGLGLATRTKCERQRLYLSI